jgi:hypothetical protein
MGFKHYEGDARTGDASEAGQKWGSYGSGQRVWSDISRDAASSDA